MASWYLVPCLKALFAEFDKIAPNRDHASDGSIGDAAHQAEPTSDHNPDSKGAVHAIDVDSDLHASFTMEDVIQFFVAECRKNNPNGTDRGRLKYFIYNRRIWSASTGWKQETYTGSSPHTEHAHFSCEYASNYETDTSAWGLIPRFGDDVTKDEFMQWSEEFHAKTSVGFATHQINGIGGAGPSYQVLADTAGRTNIIMSDVKNVLAALGGDLANEIIQGVLAGLGPAAMTDAMMAALEMLPKETAKVVLDDMAKRLAPPESDAPAKP
jgi:hypothetical protein